MSAVVKLKFDGLAWKSDPTNFLALKRIDLIKSSMII